MPSLSIQPSQNTIEHVVHASERARRRVHPRRIRGPEWSTALHLPQSA